MASTSTAEPLGAQLEALAPDGYAVVNVPFDQHYAIVTALSQRYGPLTVLATESVDSTEPIVRHRFSMSGVYGLREFPMHTDRAHDEIPPRVLLLSRARGSSNGVQTRVLAFNNLQLSSDEMRVLRREVWRVRYGRKRFLTPIVNDTAVPFEVVVRYDTCCMGPAEDFGRSAALMQRTLERAAYAEFELTRDYTLVIDNWRTLHGRSSITAPIGGRTIQRTLVKMRPAQQ